MSDNDKKNLVSEKIKNNFIPLIVPLSNELEKTETKETTGKTDQSENSDDSFISFYIDL